MLKALVFRCAIWLCVVNVSFLRFLCRHVVPVFQTNGSTNYVEYLAFGAGPAWTGGCAPAWIGPVPLTVEPEYRFLGEGCQKDPASKVSRVA